MLCSANPCGKKENPCLSLSCSWLRRVGSKDFALLPNKYPAMSQNYVVYEEPAVTRAWVAEQYCDRQATGASAVTSCGASAVTSCGRPAHRRDLPLAGAGEQASPGTTRYPHLAQLHSIVLWNTVQCQPLLQRRPHLPASCTLQPPRFVLQPLRFVLTVPGAPGHMSRYPKTDCSRRIQGTPNY